MNVHFAAAARFAAMFVLLLALGLAGVLVARRNSSPR